jgi:hypothetical protein
MRTSLRVITLVAAGAAAAVVAAPAALADPSLLPQCVNTGGAAAEGETNTECATPGNVQIESTPGEEEFGGPWGDMWGGDGFYFP